jgi:hypothetical protein
MSFILRELAEFVPKGVKWLLVPDYPGPAVTDGESRLMPLCARFRSCSIKPAGLINVLRGAAKARMEAVPARKEIYVLGKDAQR